MTNQTRSKRENTPRAARESNVASTANASSTVESCAYYTDLNSLGQRPCVYYAPYGILDHRREDRFRNHRRWLRVSDREYVTVWSAKLLFVRRKSLYSEICVANSACVNTNTTYTKNRTLKPHKSARQPNIAPTANASSTVDSCAYHVDKIRLGQRPCVYYTPYVVFWIIDTDI